ncbi:fumarate reductase-like protein [Morchella conica CCBAS932]|uniref:fumarate reductase (NADH) n=1 Tax=Morchella conica CCBAS932 TaxID=1392247 RepID=A0A3N4KV71_9PEZI|nr:fumarate reductase-like protein [Morchella conica CCBAS932]
MSPPRVIVVGGGLSGLSAAHTLYLAGGNVLVLDKQGFFGGNSTKATSGINGALTRTQVDSKIQDSVQQFYDDTMKSARDKARPDLIKVLTYKSAAAVEWLQDVFGLDLTLVSRLGGHSQPRTHRGHDAKFPGMAITYALMQKLEDLAETDPERVKIIKKARVTKINSEGNHVTGLDFEYEGKTYTEYGPVILATGGYAADFDSPDSLLKKHRPDVLKLSSTNGTHATGDGQKMVMALGGNGIDMDKVQVHPTGLVDPKDPTSKWKFLAAEALRGEGGLLLNADGNRFCDELGHRDYVSGEMFKNKFPIRLVLNSKASKVLDFHTRHYSGRGLMKKITGAELAKEIGCGPEHLQKVFKSYNDIADGKTKDPYGKKFFHNTPFDINDDFHVALMEPVVHFTMGGVEIDDRARVLNKEGKPFEGLYACGEIAGGVHGANRLGGSSLLGCVVYGRVAGDTAAEYLFQKVLSGAVSGSGSSTAAARLNQISLHIDPNTPGKLTIEWNGGNAAPSQGSGSAESIPGQTATHSVLKDSASGQDPGTVSKPAAKKEFSIPEKEFTMEEVAAHNTKDSVWVVVKGVVMDVTNFLEDHPGGVQAVMNFAGRDATEE